MLSCFVCKLRTRKSGYERSSESLPLAGLYLAATVHLRLYRCDFFQVALRGIVTKAPVKNRTLGLI